MMGGSSVCRERVARKVECKVSNRYLVKKAVDNSPFSVDNLCVKPLINVVVNGVSLCICVEKTS